MKILIVTKNWLGDILFETPAIETIALAYPQAEIVCIAPERCRSILEAHPAVHRFIPFDEKKEHRSFFSKIKFVLELRREKWDRAYLFHRSRTRAFLLMSAGVKARIGYAPSGHRRFLTHPVAEPEGRLHHRDYFLTLVERSGLKRPVDPACRFYFSPEDEKKSEELLAAHSLKQFVCFHLGANWEPKRWPAGHFARLAHMISEKWNLPVVLTGGPGDIALGNEVEKKAGPAKIISLIGQTSLTELGALFSKALFVVSGDSGPLHIASGSGARVVALFGPTDPELTGPCGPGDKIVLTFVPEGYQTPWYGDIPAGGWLSHLQPEQVMAAIGKKNWVQRASLSPKGFIGDHQLTDFRKPHKGAASNILFITLSNIGDVILTTPVLAALAAHFKGARITAVTSERARELLSSSRQVDRVVVYDKKTDWHGKRRFLKELRKADYDCVVDLRNTLIPFLVRSRQRSPVIRNFKAVSKRARHLEVLQKMKIPVSAESKFDFFSESEEVSALSKLKAAGISTDKQWIVVCPVAASSTKSWSGKGFREVIRELALDPAREVLLVGEKSQRSAICPPADELPARVHNLAGEFTLRELAAVVARASLVLSNDSAVMHLAHELDRPTAAIFGPTSHEKYGRTGPHFKILRTGVFCSPCEKAQCRFDRQACLEDLESKTVLEACKELLKAPSHFDERNEKKSRILITRTDRIGDLVLSTPVFSEIRKKFPKAYLACLTFLENREIVQGNPFLDEVLLYDKIGSEKGWGGQWRFTRRLSKKKFDTVIHLHATNRMHWLGWLARIPVRIGWDRKSPWALTHPFPETKREGKKHEAEYNFDLLVPLGISAPEKIETYFPLNDRAQASLDELLRRYEIQPEKPWIVLAPGASCPSKRWPAERFGILADQLASQYDVEIFTMGSLQDRPLVQKLQERASVPIRDLSGRLSLTMAGVFLKRASLLISNDSGPVHIASAVGTPVISVFGRNQPGLSPARWRPLGENSRVVWKNTGCDPCLAHQCEIQFLCLDVISVEDVMAEVNSLMGTVVKQ